MGAIDDDTARSVSNATRDARAGTHGSVQAIYRRYELSLAELLGVIDDAVLAALEGHWSDEVAQGAARAAHKLAGLADAFGVPDASATARRVEQLIEVRTQLEQGDVLRLSEWAVALRAALPFLGADISEAGGAATLPAALGAAGEQPDKNVVVVEPSVEFGEQLTLTGVRRGFTVDVTATAADALDMLDTTAVPQAVVLTVAESDHDGRGRELIANLGARGVPAVVLSDSADLATRVELSRLGALGFLHLPVSADRVLDAVERLIDHVRFDDMTVLAVGDDPAFLAEVSELLGAAGIRVVPLDDPLALWQTLELAPPDLLMLDADMPGVSGFDLCRVVRADERWSQLPVMLLADSASPVISREVFEAGADDYVSKPVDGPELVARIVNRLVRVRLYRRLTETDPLTGVLNRRTAIVEMTRLLGLAERENEPLSLALLELDHFKRINDLHGHPVGDGILRELTSYLLRGFPEGVLARWGGKEFLLGNYGSTAEDAAATLREVLEDFSHHDFISAGLPFHVSFSGGVSEWGKHGSEFPVLCREADSAMYAAKAAGRRRVFTVDAAAALPVTTHVDVVVVEDDESLAPLLLSALHKRNLSTEWLREGDVAARRLTGSPPALQARVVVLDWDLPGLNGPGVLHKLAEDGGLDSSRVIMLTGRTREDEVLRVLEMGAVDHVAKPFSLPVLLQRVRRQLDADAAS